MLYLLVVLLIFPSIYCYRSREEDNDNNNNESRKINKVLETGLRVPHPYISDVWSIDNAGEEELVAGERFLKNFFLVLSAHDSFRPKPCRPGTQA